MMGVRLRNEGYTHPGLVCVTVSGYAGTARLRSSDTPVTGSAYQERTDSRSTIWSPRMAVIQDLDVNQGPASCVREVHAAILKAFGCVGVITNCAVRDIPGVQRLQFPMFTSFVAISYSYSQLVGGGDPVEVFGLNIQSGELLYADCHGVISIGTKSSPSSPRRPQRSAITSSGLWMSANRPISRRKNFLEPSTAVIEEPCTN